VVYENAYQDEVQTNHMSGALTTNDGTLKAFQWELGFLHITHLFRLLKAENLGKEALSWPCMHATHPRRSF
jgi:hypothetical protein